MDEQPKTFWEKAKSAFNRAKLSRYLSFFAVISGTVILSLYQVGWDPFRIGWEVYVANTALLLFLGIYGLFFGENEGGNLFKTLITGAFQTARDEFLDRVDDVVDKGYADALPDYIVWRYQTDYANACKMKLMSVRVFDSSVLDLNKDDLGRLRTAPLKVGEHYYSQLSEEQYQTIIDIQDGKLFVDYIDDYTFFLNDEDGGGEQQVTRVKNTPKRKEKITWKQRLTRVFMILIVSLILAGFFKKAWEGGDVETANRELVTRLTDLIVSVASGINIARLLNLEDVFVLKFKASYLGLFYVSMENKSFVPTNYEEKAKKEYEEYEKKQAEEAAEVVDQNVVKLPFIAKGGN